VADDPWRKPDPPDPYAPPPKAPPYTVPPAYAPPGYAPAPHYGQPPYNPYYAYNPYQGPLPQRGGYGRLLWILCTLGILVLGGCGVGIYFLAKQATQNADAVNAFLRNVRNQRFAEAYGRLCPSVQSGLSRSDFTAALQKAAFLRDGVESFDITSSSTSIGHDRTASGRVTLVSGGSVFVTFHLQKTSGHLCILDGFTALY
jgi:hypothetical protein